jgi:hypothetical protein
LRLAFQGYQLGMQQSPEYQQQQQPAAVHSATMDSQRFCEAALHFDGHV